MYDDGRCGAVRPLSTTTGRTGRARARQLAADSRSAQIVAQNKGMLVAVPDRRPALAAKVSQLAGPRASDDGIRLLGLAALEGSRPLEDERSRSAAELADDSLHPDECRRAVA